MTEYEQRTALERRGPRQTRAKPHFAVLRAALAAAGLLAQSAMGLQPSSAASYPDHPIKVVTPFAPGAASDVELRLLADKMSAALGVPIIVENRPGAGGVIAASVVVNAPHDGYTIGWVGNNTAIGVSLFRDPFDPRKDMRPIVGVSEFPYLFVANEKSAYRSLQDFIKSAHEHPDELGIGTSSAGTSNNLIAYLFAQRADLKIIVTPYRGPSELEIALLRNDVALAVNAYGGLQGALNAKQIRVLAVTSAQRMPELPDVPTMAEQGISDFDITSWNGLYGPKDMPTDAVNLLAAKATEILKQPEMIAKFATLGFQAIPTPPERLGERMEAEIERWRDVITTGGIEKP
jgi:tripartite-type tricarboxylate transporter receptor subunit TctC